MAVVILLVIGYVGSASALQEDLNSPAQYLARNAQAGDAIAVPDHALTSAIDYYLGEGSSPSSPLAPAWSSAALIEGFDLVLHPSGRPLPAEFGSSADGSVPVTRFQKAVKQDGYLPVDYIQINGSALLLYQSSLPDGTVLTPSSGATLSGPSTLLDAVWRTNGVRITKVHVRTEWQVVLQKADRYCTAHQIRVLLRLEYDRCPERHLLAAEPGH